MPCCQRRHCWLTYYKKSCHIATAFKHKQGQVRKNLRRRFLRLKLIWFCVKSICSFIKKNHWIFPPFSLNRIIIIICLWDWLLRWPRQNSLRPQHGLFLVVLLCYSYCSRSKHQSKPYNKGLKIVTNEVKLDSCNCLVV